MSVLLFLWILTASPLESDGMYNDVNKLNSDSDPTAILIFDKGVICSNAEWFD